MEALFKASSFPLAGLSIGRPRSYTRDHPILHNRRRSPALPMKANLKKIFYAVSPITSLSSSPDDEFGAEKEGEINFDWYAQWYPLVPIMDLDRRRPHGKRVIGIDVVIWWDKNEDEWKVFADSCPHRLAPLSEGRIDLWGRLQCVYHGWCFGGSGDCKFIPQAPRDGPPIHTSTKACVAVYPSCVQNGLLWFWPNTDPLYKDIYSKKKPHYIPELVDPSYTGTMICRDMPYGWEEPSNLELPFTQNNMLKQQWKDNNNLLADREGGIPIDVFMERQDVNGFAASNIFGEYYFIPPCLFYGLFSPGGAQRNDKTSSGGTKEEISLPNPTKKRSLIIFYCIPVSPGNSRVIFGSIRNFAVWTGWIFPRWVLHIEQNLILDSDLRLIHVEEHKLMDAGPLNWHKSCYTPTKSDALVVSFRRWLNKYGGSQVDWGNKYNGELPPTPPREQLFDRYWSHTVNCSSCSAVHKNLSALKIAFQVVSICLIGIIAAAKQSMVSGGARYGLVSIAVLCFVASKWLSHFIYRIFHYHDYDHAFR